MSELTHAKAFSNVCVITFDRTCISKFGDSLTADTILIHYGVMHTVVTTREVTPGKYLDALPEGSYVRVSDLPGTRNAAKLAASRASARGDIIHVSKGLYFKGRRTRYGIATPPPEDVALEVVGRRGVGPAGVSAARALGLTTQVPAVQELATLARVPAGVPGVRFTRRNNIERVDLTYLEIAVLEVLRDWRFLVDGGWVSLVTAVASRVESGDVRPDAIAVAARREHHVEVKTSVRDLLAAVNGSDLGSVVTR